MTRQVLLWDPGRCIFCRGCVGVCNAGNYGSSAGEIKQWKWLPSNLKMVEVDEGGKTWVFMIRCIHCSPQPCVEVCPTGASYRDSRDGLVKIKESLCIGCRYCVAACPYNARWFDEAAQLPRKCLGPTCEERVARGQRPLCVEACPTGALVFGPVDDPVIAERLAKRQYAEPPQSYLFEGVVRLQAGAHGGEPGPVTSKDLVQFRETLKTLVAYGGVGLVGALLVAGAAAARRSKEKHGEE